MKSKATFRNIGLFFVVLIAAGFLANGMQSSSASKADNEAKIESSQKASKKVKAEKSSKKKAAKEKKARQAEEKKQLAAKKAAQKAEDTKVTAQRKTQQAGLANLNYGGKYQTINVNGGVPTFSSSELSMSRGAWESYGNLDSLNRATSAQAMLNKSLMPTGKRGSISSVTPTGWKNKRIAGGYLYNRSHLIGYALAGENANWKNLITGTRQLNSPEMLRYEMDVKYYLEQSNKHYVRYSVVPIFRGNELLARGVHMMAKSIGDNGISFNVYIFNVQNGVTINYADGSSNVGTPTTSKPVQKTPAQKQQKPAQQTPVQQKPTTPQNNVGQMVYVTSTGSKYHTHPHGRGTFTKATLQAAKERGLTPCAICY